MRSGSMFDVRSKYLSTGFTLLELLAVIGIIVVLVGILIPVVSNVRNAAWHADTQARIASLVNAIERYYGDFGAYPGVFANPQISAGITSAAITGLGANSLTTSENLVLSLLGGLINDSANTPPLTFRPDQIGIGAMSFNTVSPKRHAPYMEVSTGMLSNGLSGITNATDTIVPEFVDRFPEAKPILYLRARAGAPDITDPFPPAAAAPDTRQYNWAHLVPYLGANPLNPSPDGDDSNITADFLTPTEYFKHPSMPNTPRQKDTYILMSPGKDRKYGTGDDITNFGGFN